MAARLPKASIETEQMPITTIRQPIGLTRASRNSIKMKQPIK